MRFGDLVSTRESPNIFGCVIDVKKANQDTLLSSLHSKSLTLTSQDIFYVFFSSSFRMGPYFASDLILRQKYNV
jgi:hypothetical protein